MKIRLHQAYLMSALGQLYDPLYSTSGSNTVQDLLYLSILPAEAVVPVPTGEQMVGHESP